MTNKVKFSYTVEVEIDLGTDVATAIVAATDTGRLDSVNGSQDALAERIGEIIAHDVYVERSWDGVKSR